MRGQSPAAVQQAQFGNHGSLHEATREHLNGYDITHFNVGQSGQIYQSGGYIGGPGGPGCPQPGMCPQGGNCPPGYGCPTGQCGNGEVACQPHHGYSYSYKVPNDLVYPPANVPGGAVVYPYYTHKGPSDFFRKE
ncbi:MAG TPA: hypothetical protein VM452_12470 [Caulifigura sp.]|nr:hypothetical protein [Caulifigura sp.]